MSGFRDLYCPTPASLAREQDLLVSREPKIQIFEPDYQIEQSRGISERLGIGIEGAAAVAGKVRNPSLAPLKTATPRRRRRNPPIQKKKQSTKTAKKSVSKKTPKKNTKKTQKTKKSNKKK